MAAMDGLKRARIATADIERYVECIQLARDSRQQALREAAAAGVTRSEMARELGITLARVNQLLGSQYTRADKVKPGEVGSGAPKSVVKGASRRSPTLKPAVKVPEPEPHRHHYVSEAWNHTRGAYLLRQRCECGETRVVPAPTIPKELKAGPDSSIVAA